MRLEGRSKVSKQAIIPASDVIFNPVPFAVGAKIVPGCFEPSCLNPQRCGQLRVLVRDCSANCPHYPDNEK